MTIGELTAIGAWPGRVTIPLPSPSPTMAPGHFALAAAVVVSASFAIVQTGRPAVSIEPCLSKMKRSFLRAGGADPSPVSIRVRLFNVAGAFVCSGRVWGTTVAEDRTSRLPIWMLSA
jgi:hypothetical protein